MKFILGKKLNMEQVFQPDGTVVAVTKVLAGPCLVTQKKDEVKDGYRSLQCAFQPKKKANKAETGLFKKFGKKGAYQYAREFRLSTADPMYDKVNAGDELTTEIFTVGDTVAVTGVSKGKGFQGVVKRHGFAGGKKSHGHKDQLRMPGSIGSTGPAHVFKGMRMGGRTGGDQVTVTGLKIVGIDTETNILYIKGAIPGARNELLKIVADGEFTVPEAKKEVAEKPVKENADTTDKTDKKEEKPTETEKAADKNASQTDNDSKDEAKSAKAETKKVENKEEKPAVDDKKEAAEAKKE